MSVSDDPIQDVGSPRQQPVARRASCPDAAPARFRKREPYTTSASSERIGATRLGDLRGIELEIGVLNRGDRAGRACEADAHGVSFSAVLRQRARCDLSVTAVERVERGARPVASIRR